MRGEKEEHDNKKDWRKQQGLTGLLSKGGKIVHSSISEPAGVESPDTVIEEKPVLSVAIVGADYPGLRPAISVSQGDVVHRGQALLTDRTNPRITIVAPVSGRIASVEYGPRRSLSALVIQRDPDAPEQPQAASPPEITTRETLRETLLAHGVWPAFRTRPFGRLPDPNAIPQAIFVTATDSEPLAPDPRDILKTRMDAFCEGVRLLGLLTDGPVYVCQTSGTPLVDEDDTIRNVTFDGPHPSGLAGTHINSLHPLNGETQVWTIEGQDVAAIGALAETGRYDPSRIIALTGTRAAEPRLIRAVPGASLRELTAGEATGNGPVQVVSGSLLSGHETGWLGRFHRQVTMTDALKPVPVAPRPRRPKWLAKSSQKTTPQAIIPTAALERALPSGYLPVPLMRALAVGDFEVAVRLGALGLIEEDVALLSALCTSGADYGKLLRRMLDDMAAAA